jgi:hypothetical protein
MKQYPFAGTADRIKAELLKDVLAMANAWGEGDAYILIGAQEVPGHVATITPITEHLDDAALQQFVNEKTNRPILFSYAELQADGQQVAALRISKQQRPFFLKKPFGGLLANTVYLRRGSSTDVADPDEVHRMGEEIASTKQLPTLDLQWGHRSRQRGIGKRITVARLVLEPLTDDQLPAVSVPYGARSFGVNEQYYKQRRNYVYETNATIPLAFVLSNTSDTAALGVRVEFRIPKSAFQK